MEEINVYIEWYSSSHLKHAIPLYVTSKNNYRFEKSIQTILDLDEKHNLFKSIKEISAYLEVTDLVLVNKDTIH